MNGKIKWIPLLLCIMFFVSCEKYKDSDGRIIVSTGDVTDIEDNSAIGHFKIDNPLPSDFKIVNKGIILGTDSSVLKIKSHSLDRNKYQYTYTPISSNDTIILAGGSDYDYCLLMNLKPITRYYYRAFAHITNDWSKEKKDNPETFYLYGEEIKEFITSGILQGPTVFYSR